MVFVTLGSQKFQFNRLLKKIDELIEKEVIKEYVFAQIGSSDYKPKNYKYIDFIDADIFNEMSSKADIVITHGGTGAIIVSVKKGKKVIAVPRLSKYGEHVDDHQIQLVEQFDEMQIIKACYDIEELKEVYVKIKKLELVPYESNTAKIINSIDRYLLNERNKI